MELGGSGAKALARRIVLHAQDLEARKQEALDIVLEQEKEKARTVRLQNDRLGWSNRLKRVEAIATVVSAVCLGPVVLLVFVLLLFIVPLIILFITGSIWNTFTDLRVVQDCVGSAFMDVIYPRWEGNIVADTWFYLFNRTVNKSNCIF